MTPGARYAIGIDLGTTNSALAFVDLLAPRGAAVTTTFEISQLGSPHSEIRSAALPSAVYIGTSDEALRGDLTLFSTSTAPPNTAVGALARNRREEVPGRVVTSSKSWLTHRGVDRRGKLLPWASDEVPQNERLSPVEAGALVLAHLRETWDRAYAVRDESYRLENQVVIVTVPASFDLVAQDLTRAAAVAAGLPRNVRLLEEPQAAFYCWLEIHGGGRSLSEILPGLAKAPKRVLVIDVGGGTTDFSIFEVSLPEDHRLGEPPRIRRVSVSEHILLGGDNMDLAIARELERRLTDNTGRTLGLKQRQQLLAQSRALKERILGSREDETGTLTVSIAGDGRSLFETALSVSIEMEDVRRLVLDGFFPICGPSERCARRGAGLLEWGLPYAAESAVTRHLSEFLGTTSVDALLFNGGALIPLPLRERLLGLVREWQGEVPVSVLENPDMDLAVSRGAAYYASILGRARDLKIEAGAPRSLYLELYRKDAKADPELVCVMPKGSEEGEVLHIHRKFEVTVGRPVRFQLHAARERDKDIAGTLIRWKPGVFEPLPPVQTTLGGRPDERVEVTIECSIDEVGRVRLFAVPIAGDAKWEFEFQLREEASRESSGGADRRALALAEERIHHFYGKKRAGSEQETPKGLARELEKILGEERSDWSVATARGLWPALKIGMGRRARSPLHESTWLSLTGFIMRPGFGAELDPVRIDELWNGLATGPAHPKDASVKTQWWILWRRVTGGLTAERQSEVLRWIERETGAKNTDPEAARLVGSLERLSVESKSDLGDRLMKRLFSGREPAAPLLYAIGRIANRTPLHGGPDAALPPAVVERWLTRLREWPVPTELERTLAGVFVTGARLTADPRRDLSVPFRTEARRFLGRFRLPDDFVLPLWQVVELGEAEQTALFGESLPSGIRLVTDRGEER